MMDFPAMLGRFELTGWNIINVIYPASIEALARGSETILLEDALKEIQREVEKEGKVFRIILES